jgi:hypothetical protein
MGMKSKEPQDSYFGALVMEADRAVAKAQQMFDLELFVKAQMDEASLLFHTEGELEEFVEWAKGSGLHHFNSVPLDGMIRQGMGFVDESFLVRFEFLRLHGASWRIEAMYIPEGVAPLHREYERQNGSPCVVHVSFKCEDFWRYEKMKRVLANEDVAPALKEEAEYRNSYGMFSYWSSKSGPMPYIKPRVNLRDSR